jgi:ABC-type Fe3+/spermidine/putrescine transport system ATPase subunit
MRHSAKSSLKIDHVSLSYGDKVILRDVNAEIRDIIREGRTQGQVVGFLGPSGIGKTQLFRIIAGLNRPRMVKKLEWIEMAQLAVSATLFKSLSLKLP